MNMLSLRTLALGILLLVPTTVLSSSPVRIQLVESITNIDSLSKQIPASATASSSGSSGNANAAVDGNLSTRWESAFNQDPSTLTLNLGSPFSISEVVIYWETANAATYNIEGSNDNINWTVLSSFSGGTFAPRTDTTAVTGTYQYVRMNGLSRPAANVYGYSIYEMQVFGTINVTADSDNDGVDDSLDQCLGTLPDTAVSADGCDFGFIGGYDAPTSYQGYSLTWSDEFSGNALNTANWTHEIGNGSNGWGNNELQYYRAENTSVANGHLTIEARQENFGGRAYTSSRLKTQGKQFFQYGRVDIRAVLPQGTGMWPALWMLGESISDVSWPASGEIDIMELRGDEPNKISGTAHWQQNPGDWQSAYYSSGCAYPNCTNNDPELDSGTFADEFHVFSIVWNQNQILWFLDDASVPFHSIDITPASLNELQGDFFFLFNIAVGGNFLTNPNGTASFPQKMIVDYIRVYQ
jgi:beta-glucanase (GH16 family)